MTDNSQSSLKDFSMSVSSLNSFHFKVLKMLVISGGSRISQRKPIPPGGANLLFGKIGAENYMKIKEIGLTGRYIPTAPLDPPLVMDIRLNILQQVFSNIDGSIVMSFIIHKFICGGDNNLLLAQLMATTMFMCGLCTIVMTTFGVRWKFSCFTLIHSLQSKSLIKQEGISVEYQPPACRQFTLHREQVSCGVGPGLYQGGGWVGSLHGKDPLPHSWTE